MVSYFFGLKHIQPMSQPISQTISRLGRLAFVGLLALMMTNELAGAASRHNEQSAAPRQAGEPIMAIISLHDQQITVYDADGWFLRAPVSSGQKGRETPAGIFSVIQKEADHYSNMYDDAYMPHMQRLTWSGIAIHGGPLPGYAASHGCVRMPYGFAEQLFDLTRLGMRVVVAPRNATPVAIDHPALFQPKAGPNEAAASAAAAEADAAASKADQARAAAVTASREVARAMAAVRTAENSKLKADAQLAASERAIAAAHSPEAKQQAEDAKAKVAAQVSDLEAQLAAAKAELQPKLDTAAAAREAVATAETARAAAADAAHKAARELEPVSIFISRKTQRLYIRQAFQPVLDIPVTIADADRPIGTYVFTAMERANGDNNLRWSVVSLADSPRDDIHDNATPRASKAGDGDVDIPPTELASAKAALDRIVIPQDTVDRIAGMVSPRSSLIISDEPLSQETGNGTEFVVVMSGEPQGGLKHRHPEPQIATRYDRQPYWRAPMGGPFGSWWH